MKKMAKLITLLTALTMMLSAFTAVAAAPVAVDNLATAGTYVYFDDFEGYVDTDGDGTIESSEIATNWVYNGKAVDGAAWPPTVASNEGQTTHETGETISKKLTLPPKAGPSQFDKAPGVTFTGSVPMNSVQKITYVVEPNVESLNGHGIRFMKHNNGKNYYELFFTAQYWTKGAGGGAVDGYTWVLTKVVDGTRTFLYTNEGAVNATTLPTTTENQGAVYANRVHYVSLEVNGETGEITFDLDTNNGDSNEGMAFLTNARRNLYVDLKTTVKDTSFVGVNDNCTVELMAIGYFNHKVTSPRVDFDDFRLEATVMPSSATKYTDDFSGYDNGGLDENWVTTGTGENWDGSTIAQPTIGTAANLVGMVYPNKFADVHIAYETDNYNDRGLQVTTWQNVVSSDEVQRIKAMMVRPNDSTLRYLSGYGMRFMVHNDGKNFYELYIPSHERVRDTNSDSAGTLYALFKNQEVEENGKKVIKRELVGKYVKEGGYTINLNSRIIMDVTVNNSTGDIDVNVSTDGATNKGYALIMNPQRNDNAEMYISQSFNDKTFNNYHGDSTVAFFGACSVNMISGSVVRDFSVETTDAYEVNGEPEVAVYVDAADGKTADANGVIDLGEAKKIRRILLSENGNASVSPDGISYFSLGTGANILNTKTGVPFRYVKVPVGVTAQVFTDANEVTVPLYSNIALAYYENGNKATDVICDGDVLDYENGMAYIKSQPSKAVDVELMSIMTTKTIKVTVVDPYVVTSADGKLSATVYLDKSLGETGTVSGIVIFTNDEGELLEAKIASDVVLNGNVATFEVDDVANADGVKLTIWKDAASSIRPLSQMYAIR